MGLLGLSLALWTQPQRRARDLPQVLAAPDRLVETVARGADLVVWSKGEFPAESNSLKLLVPDKKSGGRETGNPNFRDREAKDSPSGTGSKDSGHNLLDLPKTLGLGKSGEWAFSRTFAEKNPNTHGWTRLAIQLEEAPTSANQPEITKNKLLVPEISTGPLVQKKGVLEWNQSGGKFFASQGTTLPFLQPAKKSSGEYGGTLPPDFLELRLGRIPSETPTWLVARGGVASRRAAIALLGRFPDLTARGVSFPGDSGVLGLWEEAGNLRAEWIFTEQAASDAWEKVLIEAKLGPKWKWVKQGRVISLQREGAQMWFPR